jgi:hypothetical protein
MGMRIKKDFLLYFLPVIIFLYFAFSPPAFADEFKKIEGFRKINECELALMYASRTGQLVTIPFKDLEELESKCKVMEEFYSSTEIPYEGEHAVDDGSFFSVHDDYGYDWLQNQHNVVGPYYEASLLSDLLTVEKGRNGDTTYVTIGLGSQEVGLDSWDTNVTIGPKTSYYSTGCCMNCLCSIHLDGLYVKINGSSYVTLYKSDNQTSIGTNVDATIDRISLATLSLGDCDGYTTVQNPNSVYTNAGYVGLKDTNITDLTVSGSVAISVGSFDGIAQSVHMALGNGTNNLYVSMATLDTTVVLGNNKYFSDTKGVLGTLYMNTLKMNVGGFLDIYNPEKNGNATTLGFGLSIPSLTLNTLSWGDADGYTIVQNPNSVYTDAGYWGWKNLVIKNLSITGTATFYQGIVQAGNNDTNLPIGTPYFNARLNNLNVSVGFMTRDVALGNDKNNLDQILRSASLSGLNVNINGSVQISAH